MERCVTIWIASGKNVSKWKDVWSYECLQMERCVTIRMSPNGKMCDHTNFSKWKELVWSYECLQMERCVIIRMSPNGKMCNHTNVSKWTNEAYPCDHNECLPRWKDDHVERPVIIRMSPMEKCVIIRMSPNGKMCIIRMSPCLERCVSHTNVVCVTIRMSGKMCDHTNVSKWKDVWSYECLQMERCVIIRMSPNGKMCDHTNFSKWKEVWS